MSTLPLGPPNPEHDEDWLNSIDIVETYVSQGILHYSALSLRLLPLSPSTSRNHSLLKDSFLYILFPSCSQSMGLPEKMRAAPEKRQGELGPRRPRPLNITCGVLISKCSGVLIGMDTGYVGMW
jgi:hypothetical protein